MPTVDRELVLRDLGVVLLEHVRGRELNGDTDEEQHWMVHTSAVVRTSPASRTPGRAR